MKKALNKSQSHLFFQQNNFNQRKSAVSAIESLLTSGLLGLLSLSSITSGQFRITKGRCDSENN